MMLLYLSAFLMDAATATLLVVRSPFALWLEEGTSPLALGLLGAAGTVPYLFSCLLFGRISDRFGRRPVLLGGVLALVPVWVGMPQCARVGSFGLLVGLWSFLVGTFWPTLQAWIGDLRPAGQVAGGLRGFNLGWSIGVMLGSLLGGILWMGHPSWPFRFGLAGCLTILGLASFAPSPRKEGREDRLRQDGGNKAEEEPFKETQSMTPPLRVVGWISNALSYFVLGSIYSLFPKLAQAVGLQTRWKWGGAEAKGSLWVVLAFLLGGGRVLSFLVGGANERWFHQPARLFLSQAVLLGALLMLTVARSTVSFAAAFVLVGGAAGFTYFWSLLHSLEGTARKGRTASYHESLLRTGDFVGSLLAGVVTQTGQLLGGRWAAASLRAPYLLSGFLVVLAAAWEFWYLSRAERGP